MDNLLKDKSKDLAINIAKKIVGDSLQSLPDINLSKKIEKPKMRDKFENAVNDCKSKVDEQLNIAIQEGTQIVEDLKSNLNDLGTQMGQLVVGTAQFSSRIAMIPPAIISATPMGPGISANMIPPMLQDLKAEGDMLSKTYDDSFSNRNKLRLDSLAVAIPGLAPILTLHDTTTSTVKPLIMLVGASCDGEASSTPNVESPISYDYDASECSSYIPIAEGDEETPTVDNCSNFSAIFDGDGVSCNNCKNYR